MSGQQDDEADKSHDATPQKLEKARRKGDVPKSADLATAAGIAGLVLIFSALGQRMVSDVGTALTALIDRPDRFAPLFFDGPATAPIGGLMRAAGVGLLPLFAVPAVAVIAVIVAQQAFVFAPSKLEPKMSRISIVSNAKNKFGRNGLFEFAKSAVKLVLYTLCLAVFLTAVLPASIMASATSAPQVVTLMGRLSVEFVWVAAVATLVVGGVDALWQHQEYQRRNRMSRKELMDEMKESEGDPHLKQERRQRGHDIAMNRMLADVPKADVIVVNPTHYAVALKWSRDKGSAPVCVAKGVDALAATMREIAERAGVPIHSDPPTARTLYATVPIGHEIEPDQYRAVAAAIRFAEDMRRKARARGR
jgi:flagellar biosynthetic protein FlhB